METIVEKKLNKAFKYFQEGNKFAAKTLINDAIESNVIQFKAWWITETNPEYQLTSKEFISFIKDVISKQYGCK